MESTKQTLKFDAMQVEAIIDRVVPIIAAPEDQDFFRGILHIRAEEFSSFVDFSSFIAKFLKSHD